MGIGEQVAPAVHDHAGPQVAVAPLGRNAGTEKAAEQGVMEQGMNGAALDVRGVNVDHRRRHPGYRLAVGDDTLPAAPGGAVVPGRIQAGEQVQQHERAGQSENDALGNKFNMFIHR